MATLTTEQVKRFKEIHNDSTMRHLQLLEAARFGDMHLVECHSNHIRGNESEQLHIINLAEKN